MEGKMTQGNVGGSDGLQKLAHRKFGKCADKLIDRFPIFESDHCWERSYLPVEIRVNKRPSKQMGPTHPVLLSQFSLCVRIYGDKI